MPDRIKILMVIDHLDSGGAQTLLVDLLAGLDRQRFEPMVCALRTSHKYVDAISRLGVPVFQLGAWRLDPRKVARLVHLVKKERIDIIHTHLTAARVLGGAAAMLTGKKLLAHDHSGDEYLRNHPRLARWLLFPLERWLMRNTEKVFAVSAATADFNVRIKGIAPEKVVIVHNWIDPARFAPDSKARTELRSRWGVPAESIVVGAVGRLSPQKGFENLVRAAHEILSRHPHVRFVLVGEGPERKTLERLAELESVAAAFFFPGFMSEVHKAYSAFDIFALPSIYETFGLVVLEAMTTGLPVVASRVGGVQELLENGRTGILVSPGDPQALAQAVGSLIDDPQGSRQMGMAAREEALERFDRRKTIARIENFYQTTKG
jgi:glycosyltransferase involved in cell wall biosynthesis